MALNRRQFILGAAGVLAVAPEQSLASPPPPFEVTETQLSVAGLAPEHDGLRVAQLSDIHIGRGSPDGRVIDAVRRVNRARPDLVLLTGDYVTWKGDPIDRVPELLGGLEAPVVATMGNHDHYVGTPGLRRGLERVGYCVLENQHTVLQLRGAPVTLFGVDDGQTRHDDVPATFKGAPRTGTRLVLAHTPNTADKLPAGAGLLCFSGHTHGGQIYVPGLTRALFQLGGQPYLRGRYEVRGNHLYVNRGLGFGRETNKPRVGSEPELSFFTLRRG